MKLNQILAAILMTGISAPAAFADSVYELTITNGSNMPVSPGALYSIDGQDGVTDVGSMASAGLIKLCTMGDPSVLLNELSANANVRAAQRSGGNVLPGQSTSVQVVVHDRSQASIHFVAMYGKSKDACAAIDLGSADLRDSSSGRTIKGTDRAISTGAFSAPSLPANVDASVCQGAADAISCLRTLSSPKSQASSIGYFRGYLPSVMNFLESRYGADDTQTLMLNGGSVSFSLKQIR
jgi:hypothetical protein